MEVTQDRVQCRTLISAVLNIGFCHHWDSQLEMKGRSYTRIQY